MYNKPNKDEMIELEEYYRQKLLEYSKQSAFIQPKPAPPQKETPTQMAEVPSPERRSEPQQLPQQQQVEMSNAERISRLHFAKAPSESNFRREKSKQPRLLPHSPQVLRTASMVSPQRADTGYGMIRVYVTTASNAIPIENADVILEKREDGKRIFMEHMTTDASGNTPISRPLPAPLAESSLQPDTGVRPYAEYAVLVRANGFEEYHSDAVMVFDRELSVVDAAMIPLDQTRWKKEDVYA